MKNISAYVVSALCSILCACGCGGGTDPVEETNPAPLLGSCDPADGWSFIGTNLTVKFTFDQNVRTKSSDISSITLSPSGSVDKIFANGPDFSVTVSGLQEETSYTLTIPSGVVTGFKTNQGPAAKIVYKFSTGRSTPVIPDDPEPLDNVAWKLSEKLGLGWNLGNQMDSFYSGTWAGSNFLMPDETCWGNDKATQATFDGVKKAGFTSVRIPVTWLKMIGDAPEYKINETWLNRVAEIVGYAEKAGLYVIINTHHDENHHSIVENGVDLDTRWLDVLGASNSSALNTRIKEEISAVWTQIANKFRDKGDWLLFEGFNEINDGGWGWSSAFKADPSKQCNILNEWNQVFVDAVRATGGNNATRWLGVPTYCANPEFEKYMTMPSDPAGRLMLSVHFYDPSEYTIGESQYSDWGHTGSAGKKASGGDEDHVKAVFGNLTDKYVNNNIPVYIGEFGCSMRAQSDTRAWKFYLYYMEYVVKAAKTYGMPCFLWDNGAKGTGQEQHGYINHGDGSYIGSSKTVIDLMVNARFNESEDYTLDHVYGTAPKI